MVNRQLEGGQALRMFEKESGAIPLLGTLLQNRIFDRLPSRTFKSSKFCTQHNFINQQHCPAIRSQLVNNTQVSLYVNYESR